MGQDQCMGLQAMPQVEIVGVADRNPQAIERLFRQTKLSSAKGYGSAEELLKVEKPDLVCVATNTTSHLAVAQMAIEAGVKRLIVEKPIGNSVAQARRLASLCSDQNVKLAVNQTRRWSTDYAAIKRCIDQGYIGSPRVIYAVPGPGGLAMIGVHWFDLIAYLGNSSFAWVVGSLDTVEKPNRRGPQFKDPGGFALAGLQNGVRGYIDISDDLNRKDLFLVIRGDAGRIEVDERLRVWHLDHPSLGRRSFPFTGSTQESVNFIPVVQEMLSDAPASCGTAEGIGALEAVVAAHLSSSRNNSKICLPLQGQDSEPEFAFP
jgi:predicted dehydrogenase